MSHTHAGVRTLATLLLVSTATVAWGQAPDMVLHNGKIVTLDSRSSIQEAVALRDGKIAAIGRTAEIRAMAGPQTQIVDLQGRMVIPGLIDSHMHAIRAAQSFATEVNWIGARSIPEALERIRSAARNARAGSWIVVAGGWTERQFRERRRPTQAELLSAAPERPVYVQLFYEAALLTPAAFSSLDIRADGDVPPRGRLERDAKGNPTGWILGDGPTITTLFDRLARPGFEAQVEGTRLFFRELNRLAITGVGDPGGFNMAPASYLPLFRVWQRRELTVRVTYSLFSQRRGKELEDFREQTLLLPMGFGDDMLKFNGIGERVTLGMYNNDRPSEDEKAAFHEAAKWAAERAMGVTVHWNNDASVGHLLEVFERINREIPIAPLRWSIAHLNDASEETLRRMKALGLGWTMQNARYFDGQQFAAQRGGDAARRSPPIRTALRIGIPVGAGTDAHRVMSYNPFVALQWMLDGRTVDGASVRGPDETPTREEALRLYTLGSAWFSHDENRRGSLETGKSADIAVLSKDYLAVPVAEVGAIESLLTLLGGRVVYAAAPYAALASEGK
ncbi:MAG: amidohydrolase [Betaproteobacteria bacterium]|nr:amidohydrolase [Betaproteobacteria bacterium]